MRFNQNSCISLPVLVQLVSVNVRWTWITAGLLPDMQRVNRRCNVHQLNVYGQERMELANERHGSSGMTLKTCSVLRLALARWRILTAVRAIHRSKFVGPEIGDASTWVKKSQMELKTTYKKYCKFDKTWVRNKVWILCTKKFGKPYAQFVFLKFSILNFHLWNQ